VLTIVTILVSMIAHSLIALIIALVIAIGAIIAFLVMWKNKKKASGVVATATAPVQTAPPASQLENYVRDARARGMSNDEIRQQLLSAGWPNDEVNKILG